MSKIALMKDWDCIHTGQTSFDYLMFRILPTVPSVSRMCEKDTELGGYPIIKGVCTIIFFIHCILVNTHLATRLRQFGNDVSGSQALPRSIEIRSKSIWKFRGKWQSMGSKRHSISTFRLRGTYSMTYSKYSFLPFGMGGRQCLGRQFAVIVMVSLVSSVLKNLNVERTTNTIQGICHIVVWQNFIWIAKDIPASYGITMAPSKEIYLKFTKRVWRKCGHSMLTRGVEL